jgi:ABC-type branched-subunit amino acid transport system ATPase component
MALSKKSFLFRKDVRLAKSKNKKERVWSKIHAINQRVQAHRQVYNAAQAALIALGCSATMQSKYQELLYTQLKVLTAAVKSGVGSAEGGRRQ